MSNEALHICLSGNPACSGINPCDACHQVYVATILPKAMVQGGFNGSRAQAAAFFQGYAQARHEVLQHIASQIQPTLNGADPREAETATPPAAEEWQEGAGQLTDEEVAQMAAPPPTDFAPEPDEDPGTSSDDADPGFPGEDRAKEVAAALLKGDALTRKASPPPAAEEATPKDAPRRSSRGKKTGESTASKE